MFVVVVVIVVVVVFVEVVVVVVAVVVIVVAGICRLSRLLPILLFSWSLPLLLVALLLGFAVCLSRRDAHERIPSGTAR